MSGMTEILVNFASSVVGGLMSLKTIGVAVLEANNNAFTTFFACITYLIAVVGAILNFLFVVICAVAAFFIDFAVQCINFTTALFYLLWRLLILFFSLLDLIFIFLESVFYFLWTGGKWTAETIRTSGHTLTENGLNTWKLFVLSLKELTNSLIGGFTFLGQFVKIVIEYTIDFLLWCGTSANSILLCIDLQFRHVCRNIYDSVYFFLTNYLLNMPKEAYLGIIVCSLTILLLRNIVHYMTERGLTFPLQPFHEVSYDSDGEEDGYDARGAEFSDDEMQDLENEQDDTDTSDESVSESYLTNSDDDDTELEVVDDSSDSEEYTASESEFSEINIQLPDLDSGYNLRRSTTPARFGKNMSPAEVQKAIDREKEKRLCVICQDQVKSVLILPCRHMCMCVECGNYIARNQHRERRVCPLCRTKIKTIMNVYL